MKPTTLTNALKQALRDQVITADQPGPVLRDFRTLLEFLGAEGVEAGGKYHVLPIKIIEELDGLLSRPLRLELKRPQIRSHPYIQGLNLLLRASGLARVRKSGAKARLVLDRAMLDQWNQLNYTEQYFQLLEAWLRLGRAEMVGERGSHRMELLWTCYYAWDVIPAKGFRLDPETASEDYVPGFYRDHYLLALMDLFGLLKVEHFPRLVTPWKPARPSSIAPFPSLVTPSSNSLLLMSRYPRRAQSSPPILPRRTTKTRKDRRWTCRVSGSGNRCSSLISRSGSETWSCPNRRPGKATSSFG